MKQLLQDTELHYKLTLHAAAPIPGGWLNRMMHLNTDQGELLLKEYSRERYPKPAQLDAIEHALAVQSAVREKGVPTVHILRPAGQALRHLPDGRVYCLMGWCDGKNLTPEDISLVQMRDLGAVCGQMHAAFRTISADSVKHYLSDGAAILEALKEHREEQFFTDCPALREALRGTDVPLGTLSPSFFDSLPKGLSHEDFTPDNLLFDERGVLAVIDFDRVGHLFPLHDVGRALLSFALRDGELRKEYVIAFAEGYRQYLSLSERDISAALKLCWCIEVPWWYRPLFFESEQGKATRFLREILWVQEHWGEI